MMLILLLIFLVASCNCVEFSSRVRNFSMEIMYFTHREHFVMSPFCIWSLLTSAYQGGRIGVSNEQIFRATILPKNNTVFMENFMKFKNALFDSDPNIEFSSTTFLFYDKDMHVRPRYKAIITTIYGGQEQVFNFKDTIKTATLANRAVQIIFPAISKIFRADDFKGPSLILSNVIYFRGSLSPPFKVADTVKEIILDENNEALGTVHMMQLKGKHRYSNFEDLSSNILEMRYNNDGKFSILFIFPYVGVKPVDVYRKLDKFLLRDIFAKLEIDFINNSSQEVDVKIPRFNIQTSMTLNKPLNNMGVFAPFEPSLGSFLGISRDHLYINTIEHKADITFTEAETIVYASTPGYFDEQSTSNIEVKQPFIFFIVEKPTATVLFGGIYSKHRYLNAINSRVDSSIITFPSS